MVSWQKNIRYNQDLKTKNKIELKINVKIKFEWILGSTALHILCLRYLGFFFEIII